MLFQGDAFRLEVSPEKMALLCFDLKGQSSNVLNQVALAELGKVVQVLKEQKDISALLLYSAKDQFVLGADVFEFMTHFKKSEEEMVAWLTETNNVFSAIEDLPYPSVAVINGLALGGGFEIALTTDFRVMAEDAKVGLLETKLGIIPGWGGTVRLSRLTGADNSLEWICSAQQYSAVDAMKIKAVDAVAKKDQCFEVAKTILQRAINGELDWKKRKQRKVQPLQLNQIESVMCFENAKGFVYGLTQGNYPAPMLAVESMQKGAILSRNEAIKFESQAFAKLSKTTVASSLVYTFLGDQQIKKNSKKMTDAVIPVAKSAVLGAGIMGGGISYQAASRGVSVLMKDIAAKALDAGMKEASQLLLKAAEKGKIKPQVVTETMSRISPVMTYSEFQQVDFVIEAVVENIDIKKSVLSEVEKNVSSHAIIATNTSTIAIDILATTLSRPENFCGMHFFNPVPKMPLVEIIKGKKTSDATIAKAVKFALQMGKTPIVVNDCAGFLVNRVLFPYFFGFIQLLSDGIDFQKIDKVMEKFGWPMGPAYLLDVVGIDTAFHAASIMAKSYPDRMILTTPNILEQFFQHKKLGQKNGTGFFQYQLDAKGRMQKVYQDEVQKLIQPIVTQKLTLSDQEILERMMLPMLLECIRCLEDKIVATPTEIDMGLLLGLGFPPFRFGALKYADDLGLEQVLAQSKKYENWGKLYQAPKLLVDMVQHKEKFYKF